MTMIKTATILAAGFLILVAASPASATTYHLALGPVGPMSSFDPNEQEPVWTTPEFALPGPYAQRIEVLFPEDKHLLIEWDSYFEDEEFNGMVARTELNVHLNRFGGPPGGGGNFITDVTIGFLDAVGGVIFSYTEPSKVIPTWGGLSYTEVPLPMIEAYGIFVDFGPDVGPLDATASVDFEISGNLTVVDNACVPSIADIAPVATGGDGIVDGADLGALLARWKDTGASIADIAPVATNGDGIVDGADLGALLARWKNTCDTPASPVIPEPATMALLGLGSLALLRRK